MFMLTQCTYNTESCSGFYSVSFKSLAQKPSYVGFNLAITYLILGKILTSVYAFSSCIYKTRLVIIWGDDV